MDNSENEQIAGQQNEAMQATLVFQQNELASLQEQLTCLQQNNARLEEKLVELAGLFASPDETIKLLAEDYADFTRKRKQSNEQWNETVEIALRAAVHILSARVFKIITGEGNELCSNTTISSDDRN